MLLCRLHEVSLSNLQSSLNVLTVVLEELSWILS